jgi:hypothetical protein
MQVLDYVDEKTRVAALQKNLRAWERKVAIQEMAHKSLVFVDKRMEDL